MIEQYKDTLIDEAKKQYGEIYPTGNNTRFDDNSFTTMENKGILRIMFWFNTNDNSTHIVNIDIPL